MNEDNWLEWATELADANARLLRQTGPAIQQILPLARHMEPHIQFAAARMRELEPLIREHEALRRRMEPYLGSEAGRRQIALIAEAAAQMARIGPWPKTGGGALPLPLRLAAAVDADMRDLLPAREPVVHQMTLATTVTGTADLTGVGTVTGTGNVALPPMWASGQMTVKDRPKGLAALSDGGIVFLVLVWLYALVLPWFGSAALPPELHAMLTDGYATIAIALAITWRIRDEHT